MATEPTKPYDPGYSHYIAHFSKDKPPLGYGREENQDNDNIEAVVKHGTALERLVNILSTKTILATPMPWTGVPAVSFSECPFWSLLRHTQQYSRYGVGFLKKVVFNGGGGPAFYIRQDLYGGQKTQGGFDPLLWAFLTPYAPDFADEKLLLPGKVALDFTHEREWRTPGNFGFDYGDVSFVIVDTLEDFEQFPPQLKDAIGRDKFIIMHVYELIEGLWPTHLTPAHDA